MQKNQKLVFFFLGLIVLGFFLCPNLNLVSAASLTTTAPNNFHDWATPQNTCTAFLIPAPSVCAYYAWDLGGGSADLLYQLNRVDFNRLAYVEGLGYEDVRVIITGCYTVFQGYFSVNLPGNFCVTLADRSWPQNTTGVWANEPAPPGGWPFGQVDEGYAHEYITMNPMPNVRQDNTANYNAFVLQIQLQHARLTMDSNSFVTYGRHVSIDQFNPSAGTVQAGDQITINWSASEISPNGNVELWRDIPGDPSGLQFEVVPNSGSRTYSTYQAGTAYFTLKAKGYGNDNWIWGSNLNQSAPPVTVSTDNPSDPYGFKQFSDIAVTIQPTVVGNPPSVTLTYNGSSGPVTINSGDSGTLQWTVSDSTYCDASDGPSPWKPGIKDHTTGTHSENSGPIISSATFGIYCYSSVTDRHTFSRVDVIVNGVPLPPPPLPPPPPGCSDGATSSILEGITTPLAPGQTESFTVQLNNTGSTRWYDGNAYRLIQKSGPYSILTTASNPSNASIYGPPFNTYGHLPARISAGTSVSWTFNLTAPATPGNYNVQMQMRHYAPWDYENNSGTVCAAGPGSNADFGSTISIPFTVAVPSSTLTVTIAGTGTGTVTSAPAGINCGADCSEVYSNGTPVTLTAANGANSVFAGWSGGGCSGTGTCVVTVSAATNVTATFNLLAGTIVVNTNHLLGNWSFTGGVPSAGSGTNITYANVPPGSYNIIPGTVAGYDVSVSSANPQNVVDGGTTTFTINYVIQTGVVNVNASISQGSWTVRNSLNTAMPPTLGSQSGTAYTTYTLPIGTYTGVPATVAGYNTPANVPLIVTDGSNQNLTFNYTPVAPPTLNSATPNCGAVNLSWNDSSGETAYRIYRTDQAGGGEVLIKSLGSNVISYVDPSTNIAGTNALPNHTYTYILEVTFPFNFVRTASTAPIFVRECAPNMNVDVDILSVYKLSGSTWTATTYTPAVTIADGDVLRFRVTISNSGEAAANITRVYDTLSFFNTANNNLFAPLASPALPNPTGCNGSSGSGTPSGSFLICVDTNGNNRYNQNAPETGTISGTVPNLNMGLNGSTSWGSKGIGSPNWVFTFMARVSALGNGTTYEEVSDQACIGYTYAAYAEQQECDEIGPLLFRTTTPRVPEFREVTP